MRFGFLMYFYHFVEGSLVTFFSSKVVLKKCIRKTNIISNQNNVIVKDEKSPFVYSRLVAIGDLHGSLIRTRKVFYIAKVIDENDNWIGGNHTIVIQTGDMIDRGDDTKKLLFWVMDLQRQAESQGGKLIALLGNHEYMNLIEYYKYVNKKDIVSFGDESKRKFAFSKQGKIGHFLRNLNVVAQFNDTIFVHGGITNFNLTLSIQNINLYNRELMKNESFNTIEHNYFYRDEKTSPIWYRGYSKEPESQICPNLTNVLKKLGGKRMVMGHTITKSRHIETRCEGRAIFIDVNISKYTGSGNFAALEITEHHAKALYINKTVNLPFAK